MASPERGPVAVLEARAERRRHEARVAGRRELALSVLRLALALAGAVVLWAVIAGPRIAYGWLALPSAAFLIGVWVHDRARRHLARKQRGVAWCRAAIERIEGRWAGTGAPDGGELLVAEHPYARDLDVFGPRSLFERLARARTSAGLETLARWLSAPASIGEVRERQEAVAALAERLDLREDLAVLGEAGTSRLAPGAILEWTAAPQLLEPRPVRLATTVLAAANLLTLGGVLAELPGAGAALVGSLLLSAAVVTYLAPRVRRILAAVEQPADQLRLLAELLARFREEPVTSGRLSDLQRSLEAAGLAATARIARLGRLVELRDSRRNMIFAPIAALLLLGTRLAAEIERWRRDHAEAAATWLRVAGELEALASLAAYRFEQPDDPFPELIEGPPRFEAQGLGHPLLESGGVRNDVRLGPDLPLLVISGSNMSGKSTLLRAVGVATVMALAGAPVRAQRLVLTPLQVGAAINVVDSLQDGRSHFYAEILRLRDLVRRAEGEPPLLFLLDEILRGTNSRDRRSGARAVLRALGERGALGLVTTHDLALAEIATDVRPGAATGHFTDRLEDGRLVFDHTLRPGVAPRSNALDLMREVGLEIASD